MRMLLSLFCLAVAQCTAFGAPVSTDLMHPEGFHLTRETLSQQQRMELYLCQIENFVGWVEAENTFLESDAYEPGGGYFQGEGKGVTWARGNNNLIFAYAVLLTASPDRTEFTFLDLPRETLFEHARKAMRSLCFANTHVDRRSDAPKVPHEWGGPSWQAALEFTACAWASELLESDLDQDTLDLVRQVLLAECEAFRGKEISTAKSGNTGSEDCAWNCPLLAFAANKHPDLLDEELREVMPRKWAMNATSAPQDEYSDKLADGHPLSWWIVSQNVFSDLTLENHGFWSTPYQTAAIALLGEGELAYRYFGRPIPYGFNHHGDAMWAEVNGPLLLEDGGFHYPQGQDWAWKEHQHMEYLAWRSACHGDTAATAYESRAVQMLLQRQLGVGTGSWDALDLGFQTMMVKRMGMSYLLHRYFPNAATMSFDEASRLFDGIHVFPHVKVALHRTPEKVVSVSWKYHQPAIFVLPNSGDHFEDTGFFTRFDARTGAALMKVSFPEDLKEGEASAPSADIADALAEEGFDGSLSVGYSKHHPGGIIQYVQVVSLPGPATLYATVFRTERACTLTFDALFPVWIDMPPGFTPDFQRKLGKNWVNWNERLAIVSSVPLPKDLPENEFAVRSGETFSLRAGQWFAPTALVLYAGQDSGNTRQCARHLRILDFQDGQMQLKFSNTESVIQKAVVFGAK